PELAAPLDDEEIRRYARRVGRVALPEVTAVGELLTFVHEGEQAQHARAARALRQRVELDVGPETSLESRDLAIGGRDLMAELGLAAGPRVGKLLARLLDCALRDPSINTRGRLIELARALPLEE